MIFSEKMRDMALEEIKSKQQERDMMFEKRQELSRQLNALIHSIESIDVDIDASCKLFDFVYCNKRDDDGNYIAKEGGYGYEKTFTKREEFEEMEKKFEDPYI